MRKALTKIQEAYALLDFPEDWDQDGGKPADPIIFNQAMLFIHLILNSIPNILAPEINLCKDATIDIEFKNEANDYELLINVERNTITCYGNHKNGGGDKIVSSQFKPISTTDIIEWCKKHMV